MRKPVIALMRLYQKLLSPLIGNQCRFTPTCSAYGIEAVGRYGVIKGLLLTVCRIGRCQPFARGPWVDPVPERFDLTGPFRYNRAKPKPCSGSCDHRQL